MKRVRDKATPKAGQFSWHRRDGARFLMFACPKGQGACGVPVAPGKLPNGASWAWDGNLDHPTLSPSINCVGGCRWHGFIREGVAIPA